MRLTRIVCLTTAAFVIASGTMLRAQQEPSAPNGPAAAQAPQAGPGGPGGGRGQGGRGGDGRGFPPVTHGLGNVAAGGVLEPAYDKTPPELPADLKSGGVLIFSKTNGFRLEPGMQSSDSALAVIAKLRGWPYFVTENGAVMNPDQLSKFKLVIWNNTSGDTLNDDQKAAFKAWLEKGGTYFGIHGAGGDPVPRDQTPNGLIRSASSWKWLVTDVLGVQFIGHAHIQPADIHIEDTKSPLTKGLPAIWRRADEWYAFSENPRSKPGFHIIAAVDEKSYEPDKYSMGGDHPSIWWHCVGNGRALFSALGHGAEMYQEPLMIQFLDNAMSWGLAESGHACSK
jgi:type 1 glutamine amidotransferase